MIVKDRDEHDLHPVRGRCIWCKTVSTVVVRPGQKWFCIYCSAFEIGADEHIGASPTDTEDSLSG